MDDSSTALVQPFPMPKTTSLIRAFDNLYLAAEGSDAQKRALGHPASLPRPWDPATIIDPQLRYEAWLWLEDVVAWFNHEHVWNLGAGYIPPCWPRHPHLVHEIAVLADLRRQAGTALTSQPLEEWHRYAVPNFLDRMKQRMHDCCDTEHTDSPGRTKHTRHRAARPHRLDAYDADCQDTADNNPGWDEIEVDLDEGLETIGGPEPDGEQDAPPTRAALHLVPRLDPETGELL